MYRPAYNPPQRFASQELVWDEAPPAANLSVIEDDSQSILTHNTSPDIPFSWSVNPYRGCTHACSYCYARDWHAYLGLGAGTDHDARILIKLKAAALLEAAFQKPSWQGEYICFSGITDCYQPLERKHLLTRACLEVCARYQNPVGIITRSPLITRDLDLLRQLPVRVSMSIPLLDPDLCRRLEPGAPAPTHRLAAIRALADAGIPVGVSVSPLILGLNEHSIAETLTAAREAGASYAWMILLRLSPAVGVVFERRLREVWPERADTVLSRLRRARGGELQSQGFGNRMRGEGDAWELARRMFEVWKNRLGFEDPRPFPEPSPFRRPTAQLSLFGGGAR